MSKQIIERVEQAIRSQFEAEGSGHDWYHIDRVRKLALQIGEKEGGVDLFVVELIALMHEMTDTKLFATSVEEGIEEMRVLLEGLEVEQKVIDQVLEDVPRISFSKGKIPHSLEGKIAQDADRVEALGAIGIARCFAYGGSKQRLLYDPTAPLDPEHGKASSLHHFFEKLFLLKEKLNTDTARAIAEERDVYMHAFVDRFLDEWKVV